MESLFPETVDKNSMSYLLAKTYEDIIAREFKVWRFYQEELSPQTRYEWIIEGQKRRQNWINFHQQLATIDDVFARRVLLLHGPEPNWKHDTNDYICRGCDYAGYEAEPPEWPCATTIMIAEHYGINVP